MVATVITLELPYPLSVNRYWTNRRAKTKDGKEFTAHVPTKEAVAYKTEVGWLAKAAGIRMALADPIELDMVIYPHLPQDWEKRVRENPEWWDLTVQCLDIDNARKVVYDSLKGIVFTDDKMVRKDSGLIAIPDGKARCIVTIKPYVREHPQAGLFHVAPTYVPQVRKEKPAAKTPKREQPTMAPREDGKPF